MYVMYKKQTVSHTCNRGYNHSYNRRLEQKLKQMVVDETTTEDVVFQAVGSLVRRSFSGCTRSTAVRDRPGDALSRISMQMKKTQ